MCAMMPNMDPPAQDAATELAALRRYVEVLSERHNVLIQETQDTFVKVGQNIVEVERKLGITEKTLISYDQRIASNDVWLKAISADMSTQVVEIIAEAGKLAGKAKSRIDDFEKYLAQLDVDNRPQAIETGVGAEVRKHLAENLGHDMTSTVQAMTRQAAEALGDATMTRLAALALQCEGSLADLRAQGKAIEGVQADLKAHGMAIDAIRVDGTRLQDSVKLIYDEVGKAQCPCASDRCPCKGNSRPAARGCQGVPDPFQARCPWGGGRMGTTAQASEFLMSPSAEKPNHGPFGVGAGIGASTNCGGWPGVRDQGGRRHEDGPGGRGLPGQGGAGGGAPGQPGGPPSLPPGLLGEELGKLTLSSKVFEEKTAREKPYQYDGNPEKQGPAWRSDTFDYFVSKCTAAGPWLTWAERHGPIEITAEEIVHTKMSNVLMTDDLNHHRALPPCVWVLTTLPERYGQADLQEHRPARRPERVAEAYHGDQLEDGLRQAFSPKSMPARGASSWQRRRVAGDCGLGDALHRVPRRRRPADGVRGPPGPDCTHLAQGDPS